MGLHSQYVILFRKYCILFDHFYVYFVSKESFVANLLRLIQKMKPQIEESKKAKKKKNKVKTEEKFLTAEEKTDVELQKRLYPGLAMPDDPNARVCTCFGCCSFVANYSWLTEIVGGEKGRQQESC